MQQSILNKSRLDKFIMLLDVPKALKVKVDSKLEENFNADPIQFSCIGSPVPAVTIPHIDVPFGGQVHKTTSNFRDSYPPISFNFFIDSGWKNYYILFSWLNLFNQEKTGFTEMNYKFSDENQNNYFKKIPFADLTTIFKTYTTDEFNNKLIEFTYTNAFITGLSEINFNYQEAGQITSKATFVFNQMHCKLIKNIDKKDC